MAGLSSTGFEAKALSDVVSEMEADEKGNISPTLNTSATSLIGQLNGVTASQLRQLWELGAAIYASQDPDQATGDALTALGALTGTVRRVAYATRVVCQATLSAGTYTAGTLVAYVAGDPTKRFQNESTIVSVGGANTATFVCQTTGPVTLNDGTLTVIAGAVAGWTAINNAGPGSVTLGDDEESDTKLRARRITELARRGSSTVDAMRADMLQVANVTFCAVYENDTDATDGSGRPPHSVEVVLLGGTTQAVVDAIWAAKPAGIQAYGTSSGTANDTQGVAHAIGYTRPTAVPIYVDMDITATAGRYGGDTPLRQLIVDYVAANLSVGHDVIQSRLVALALGYAGVIDAVVRVGTAPNPSGTVNVVIGAREYAQLVLANVAVETQTLVSGPP